MFKLSPDAQVAAFRLTLDCENRSKQIGSIVARIKHTLLSDPAGVSLPDAVGAFDQLRWQLNNMVDRLSKLEEAVGIQRRAMPTKRRAPVKYTLKGSTESLKIPDVMSILSGQQKTGTLWIKAKDERFILELLEGAVVHVASDSPRPEQRLGTILVAQNKISTEKLEGFLEEHCSQHGRFGELIKKAQLVSETDLCDALEFQVRTLFQRIFSLENAVFAFSEGAVSDLELRVSLNTTQLLLDSARVTDEETRDADGHSLDTIGPGEMEFAEPAMQSACADGWQSADDDAAAAAVDATAEDHTAPDTDAAATDADGDAPADDDADGDHTDGAESAEATDDTTAAADHEDDHADEHADAEHADHADEHADAEHADHADEQDTDAPSDTDAAASADDADDADGDGDESDAQDHGDDDGEPARTKHDSTIETIAKYRDDDDAEVTALPGLNERTLQAMIELGYRTFSDVRHASDEDLLCVSGIGKRILRSIRKHLRKADPSAV